MNGSTLLVAVHAFLEATDEPGYRLSSILAAQGYTRVQLAVLRERHLDALVAYLHLRPVHGACASMEFCQLLAQVKQVRSGLPSWNNPTPRGEYDDVV